MLYITADAGHGVRKGDILSSYRGLSGSVNLHVWFSSMSESFCLPLTVRPSTNEAAPALSHYAEVCARAHPI